MGATERRRGHGASVRWADGRTTGGIDAVRGQGCYAHATRAGAGCDARTFRLVLGLLARREHQDEVDPAGLEVRGQGEGPDPDDHCTWPCARLEERLRNCSAAPRGTAGQKHAELKRKLAFEEAAFLIEL